MIAPDDPGVRFKAAPSRWKWTDGSLFHFLLFIICSAVLIGFLSYYVVPR